MKNQVASNRITLFFALGIWLIVTLACNMPGKQPEEATIQELRQTLSAQSTQVAQGVTLPAFATTSPAFWGQYTAEPFPDPQATQSLSAPSTGFRYFAQSGDSLHALAARFGVAVEQIIAPIPLPERGYLPIGLALEIPNQLGSLSSMSPLMPDSEIINSPSALGFKIGEYVYHAGGYLVGYSETVKGQILSGIEILELVSIESSVNPRFLLALLEFRSGWVLGEPVSSERKKYPLGFSIQGWEGLYKELVIVATHLNAGYYGWRNGSLLDVKLRDNSIVRINPVLNAGSVALLNLFSKFYSQDVWQAVLYGDRSFVQLMDKMFGDPWENAASIGPIFPDGLVQPAMELPFAPGERWSLTGGPHESWKTGSPRGAIDLAPVTGEAECAVSRAWVTASASGLVVRSERNVVAIDLDGDGFEQTGWVLVYLHIADKDRVNTGAWVNIDDRIGHPSCEGGASTGTHVHITRKFNGEWLEADGPLQLVLSGWVAFSWSKNYQGELRNGDQTAVASPVGPHTSIIVR